MLELGAGPLSLVLRKLTVQDLCRIQEVGCDYARRSLCCPADAQLNPRPLLIFCSPFCSACRCARPSGMQVSMQCSVLGSEGEASVPPPAPALPAALNRHADTAAHELPAAQDDSVWQAKALELYPAQTVRLGEHYSTYQVHSRGLRPGTRLDRQHALALGWAAAWCWRA